MPTDVPRHRQIDDSADAAPASSELRSARREARQRRAALASAAARTDAVDEGWARDPDPAAPAPPSPETLARQIDDLRRAIDEDLAQLRADVAAVASSVVALYAATEDLQRWVLENAPNLILTNSARREEHADDWRGVDGPPSASGRAGLADP